MGVGGIEAEIWSKAVLMRHQMAGTLVLRVEGLGTLLHSQTLVLADVWKRKLIDLQYM